MTEEAWSYNVMEMRLANSNTTAYQISEVVHFKLTPSKDSKSILDWVTGAK